MATAPDEVSEIQRQMARIRMDLHQNMQGVVAGAEAVTSWQRYVKMYPWACLGGALALGFLIVPRKHRSITKIAETAAHSMANQLTGGGDSHHTPVAVTVREKPKKKKGLFGMLFGFVGPIALRAAQGYAVQYVEGWIMQQAMQNPLVGGPMPNPPGGPPPQRPR